MGVDAVGLVFHPKSPRCVSLACALSICVALPPLVRRIGLFMDAKSDEVSHVLATVPVDMLQFHGEEDADYCRQFGRPYIKALGFRDLNVNLDEEYARYQDAHGLLLDAHGVGEMGGSGEILDWRKLKRMLGSVPIERLVLAGGLCADNVVQAVRESGIHTVDVSSGVESSPGVKDHALVKDFMHSIQNADLRPAL